MEVLSTEASVAVIVTGLVVAMTALGVGAATVGQCRGRYTGEEQGKEGSGQFLHGRTPFLVGRQNWPADDMAASH